MALNVSILVLFKEKVRPVALSVPNISVRPSLLISIGKNVLPILKWLDEDNKEVKFLKLGVPEIELFILTKPFCVDIPFVAAISIKPSLL